MVGCAAFVVVRGAAGAFVVVRVPDGRAALLLGLGDDGAPGATDGVGAPAAGSAGGSTLGSTSCGVGLTGWALGRFWATWVVPGEPLNTTSAVVLAARPVIASNARRMDCPSYNSNVARWICRRGTPARRSARTDCSTSPGGPHR